MPEIQLELEKPAKRFELLCAITIAIFAAVLAMTDLGSSKYGDDEIMGTNEKSNVYAWYQSKSIKQSLEEGQRDLLKTLLESGSIMEDKVPALQSLVSKLDEEITRYKQEKKELLVGSAATGRENWAQEIDGELGKVVGAIEWEKKLDVLGRAGDIFDVAVLFLQICLVLGAVSLVLQAERLQWTFYGAMCLLGLFGLVRSIQAFLLVMSSV